MGLDVYLYLNKNPQKFKELNGKLNKLEYDTPEYKELEKQLEGFETRAELDSAKYPEHMFKVGYLRSSYNDGGINSVLRRTIGMDLYDIFQPDEQEYFVTPDWNACLQRAKDMLREWNKYVEEKGSFDVMEERFNSFVPISELPTSGGDALKLFFNQWEKNKGRSVPFDKDNANWYSNREGAYFMNKHPELIAAIPGAQKSFMHGGQMDPVMFLIYKKDKSDFDWYTKALEITVEMCEWVLAQKNYDGAYILHWSG